MPPARPAPVRADGRDLGTARLADYSQADPRYSGWQQIRVPLAAVNATDKAVSGLVVDGGIYRHDFVAQAVLQGIVQTSLDTEVPVLSAVLTPHHFHDHAIHEAFFKDHMRTKGEELAEACLSMIETLNTLSAS